MLGFELILLLHDQVVMTRESKAVRVVEKPKFVANRPFLCLLIHQHSQLLLFAGKVVKPTVAA